MEIKGEKSLGDIIRIARKRAGITQKQLSEKSGIAEITIRQYEANKYRPKHESLQKIADALGYSVQSLRQMQFRSVSSQEQLKAICRDFNCPLDVLAIHTQINIDHLNRIAEGKEELTPDDKSKIESTFRFYGWLLEDDDSHSVDSLDEIDIIMPLIREALKTDPIEKYDGILHEIRYEFYSGQKPLILYERDIKSILYREVLSTISSIAEIIAAAREAQEEREKKRRDLEEFNKASRQRLINNAEKVD